MITKETSDSLIQAYRQIQNAEMELSRPQEDVVTLSVCQSARNSMKQMMRTYLSAHSIQFYDYSSLNDLLDLCVTANGAFSAVDFTNIDCKDKDHANCDGKYCTSIENVTYCINKAGQMKEIVWQEFNITE